MTADANAERAPAGGDQLGRAAARGGTVTVAGQLVRIVVQLASLAVLARFLSPRDYGLVAVVLALVGVGEIFRDFGLSTAAVQARTLSPAQRDNLFWANAAIGLVLSGIACAAAGLLGRAFHEPLLVPVAQAVGATFLLNGLSAQYRAGLQRDLRFAALAVVDIAAQVLALVAAVLLAVAGAGYWALVGQQVVQATAALALVVTASRWWPGRPRRGTDVRGFLRFGRTFVTAQLVGYAAKNVDSVVLGARYGFETLGVYNRAYQVLMGPLARVRAPTTTVAVPVLAKLQDDEARFGAYVRRGQVALGYTFVPVVAVAAGAADPLVRLALGERWLSVAPLFAVLAVAAAFETLPYVGFWVYLARGLTGPLLRYDLMASAMKISLILLGSQAGALGVAAGYAAGSALNWPLSLWRLSRVTALPLAELVRGGARIMAVGVPAGIAAHLAAAAAAAAPSVIRLAAAVCAGILVYVVGGLVSSSVRRDESTLLDIARRVMPRGPLSPRRRATARR